MKQFSQLYEELRDRHLLWLGGLLIAGMIIIPAALLKSAASSPVPPAPVLSASIPGAAALPVVTARQTADSADLLGAPHDPFNQGAQHAPKSISSPVARGHAPSPSHTVRVALTARAGGGRGTTGSAGSSGGGTSSSRSSSTSTATVTTTVTSTSTSDGTPKPVELAPEQAYSPTIGITDGTNLDTLDGVGRLAPLPNSSKPLVLMLGVLQGGQHVLFAVLPGSVVSGPGRCVPGNVDCEVVELAPGQVESVAQSGSGNSVHVAQFAVTALHAARYSSVAAAQLARVGVSARGQSLLAQADLPAAGLFPFNQSLGALTDQRSLNAGGN